ncbi:hypothetical protein ACI7YT_09020 [Microbacterium sp. M]|uniref:hypothetical protein n=1 Tax=Microbacterium sp. M TaxID=3377125 RepID=UPI0038679240
MEEVGVIVPVAIAAVVILGGTATGIVIANKAAQAEAAAAAKAAAEEAEEAVDDQPAEVQAPASPEPTATTTPTPVAPVLKAKVFSCGYEVPNESGGSTTKSEIFKDVHEIWASDKTFTKCEAQVIGGGTYSTEETTALKTAYGEPVDYRKLSLLWGMCAETTHFYQTNGPINEVQQAEANGVLALCPDHPSADVMANGSKEQQERNAGLRFGAGVFEVGTQIQPGLYRATGEISDCYWERLDAAGEIIDNNFVSAATQVELTIEPSDFSVHFTSCGEFVKVG